ncbi:MAG: hypothetical protein E7568_03970 [Ruminococcaceae bacterium]|nr:hypothetical protein [Oscillospiraceae bacterium]
MKKIICVLLVLLSLAGCGSINAVTPVNRGIAYRAHIFYYGKEYDCDVKIDEQGRAEYRIRDGQLSGLCLCFYGDKIKYSYMDKEFEESFALNGGMLNTLYEMNESISDDCKVEKTDNEWVLNGETANGEYELFLSGGGLPIKACLDGDSFYVDFYDVTLIKCE